MTRNLLQPDVKAGAAWPSVASSLQSAILCNAGGRLNRWTPPFASDLKARAFDPAKAIEPLRAAISEAGGAALLIVDPLLCAIAADSRKNAEMRRALQPLVDLAAREGAALLGIAFLQRGGGS